MDVFRYGKKIWWYAFRANPKSVDAGTDELMIPRSSLKDTYDQILSDLDAGIADLPGTALFGKATKWAAFALKSRAALYAARIAKYHHNQVMV